MIFAFYPEGLPHEGYCNHARVCMCMYVYVCMYVCTFFDTK